MYETRTTIKTQPLVQGEAPQKVYEKKSIIIRFSQVIWYILGLIEVLLVFRFALKLLGASQASGFTNFIYSITTPLSMPFNGIFGEFSFGSSIFEWSSIIAGIVYLCVAWGLVYFLQLIYPISPNDVETN